MGGCRLTGGKLDYDNLKRKFDLGVSEGAEKGDTDGHLWAFSTRVGYDIAQPGSRMALVAVHQRRLRQS